MNMKTKNNIISSVILSGAKNLYTATVDAFRSFTAFRMTRVGKCAAIRKATVLCTLCSVLLLAACTHDEITAPANGLPQGMRAVTVDIRLPEGKPGFDAQSTGTRGEMREERGEMREESALCSLHSPLSTRSEAAPSWAEGDELMMSVGVADAENNLVAVALTLKCDENGTWDVLTDKSYSVIATVGNQTVKPYTELPLLAKATDLTLTEGLTLMVDETMGEVAYHQMEFLYAPEMELTSDGTSTSFAPKADASTTAPEKWTANYEYNVATGEKHERTWSTLTARLRVYTGAKGDVVTLSSVQFDASNLDNPREGTYTATTDADGYACFYGVMASPVTSGFTLSLTAVTVGEGDAAVTCPVSPVTLLEATDLVPVKLEAGKSYRLDAAAKRPDTEKWAIFSSADITADAVSAALAAGKSTIYVSGEVTDALKTAINAQADGTIDLVLSDATAIGNYAFQYCYALESVTLPAATTIGEFAFNSCTALSSVNLPLATTIGKGAFNSCTSFTSVELPAATSIGFGAFQSCDNLTTLTFGAVITEVGTNAFAGIGAVRWTSGCHLTLAAGQESHETYPADVANRKWVDYTWKSITLTGSN